MTPDERENLLYRSGKRVLIDKEEQILIKKFNELFINKSIDTLDIGCGSGEMMEVLNNFGSRTFGIDFSKEAIEICKKKKLNANQADLDTGIKFDDDQFDLVWAGDVLEHVFDPMYLLKEIRRVLKKDGYLFFSIPNDLHISKRILTLLGGSYQHSAYKKSGAYKHHTFFSLGLLRFFFDKSEFSIVDLNRKIRIPVINKRFFIKNGSLDLFAMSYFGVAK